MRYDDHRTRLADPETSLPSRKASTGPRLQEGGSSVSVNKFPGMIHQPGYHDIQQAGHDESQRGISSGNTWDHDQSIPQILPPSRPSDQYSPNCADWNLSASWTDSRYQHTIDRYTNLALSPAQSTLSSGYDGPGEGGWYAQRDMESDWHERQMEVAPYGSREAQQFGRESSLDLPYQNSHPVLVEPNLNSGQYIPQHSAPSATENYLSFQQTPYYQEYYGALPTTLEHYSDPSTSSGHSNGEFQDEDQPQDGYE